MIQRDKALARAAVKILLLLALSGGAELNAQEKSFLWKVQSEEHSLYILGSVHLLKKEHYPLPKIIEATFAKAERLVLEVDMAAASSEKTQQLALKRGLIADGSSLPQNVGAETYELVARRARELGLEPTVLSPFKPWFAAMTMAAVRLQKLGFHPELGVDRYLARRARDAGKPTAGFETPEFQIGLFDRLSARDQELLLRRSMDEMEYLEKNLDEILQAWKNGDTGTLEKHLLVGMRDYPQVHEKLIDERNLAWLPQIERLLARGESALVVVGAAHLVGKNGIVELLKGRGYRVEQL